MNRFKILISFLAIVVLSVSAKAFWGEGIKSQKVVLSLSTFSLYDIAKHVTKGDDNIELVMILPFGVDPHSFEPTPKLMAKISKSNLVVYNGAGLEPWTDGFEFRGKVIDMSKHVELRKLSLDHHHHHHPAKKHKAGSVDPHYWLNIDNMIKATNIITDELIKISPKHKKIYLKNRDKYIASLKKLDDDYKNALSKCQNDTIVVNHNAFSYMAQRYHFHVYALSGLSPEAQPSAKKMIELIKLVKKHNIPTVFFESFASDKAIKSIAGEAKVSVDVLQPLGNITANEADKKLGFEEIMRDNLKKISKALKCQ